MVTGSSSGIGEAIARHLAADGVGHIVLVARRRDRLQKLAAELDAQHGTRTEVLVADLGDPDDLARVADRLHGPGGGVPIDLLVNNAGVGAAGEFSTAALPGVDQQIAVNLVAVVHLCHAALAPMIERGHGAVMNISSLSSYQPAPAGATYAATKAFVNLFSDSLYEELRGTGVTITAVLPGYTRTQFHDRDRAARGVDASYDEFNSIPDFAWLSAEAVADAAVVATAQGKARCIPGLGYRLLAGVVTPIPPSARRWLMGRISKPSRTAGRARRRASRT
jgi:short-subunit dehydrogenase